MTDTITSNSGVLYDIVDIPVAYPLVVWENYIHPEPSYVLQKSSAKVVEINGNNYITEDKNLMKYSLSTSWECNYSFDSSLPSNPPIAVCSKCGSQKRERTESEKNDFWKELEKFMKYEWYTDFQIEQMKDFLSSNWYL